MREPGWLLVSLVGALALVLLRIYSLARGVVWIWQHGQDWYARRSRLAAAGVLDPAREAALYDRFGGRFFPFGPRSYRLRRWATARRRGLGRVGRLPLSLFRLVWRFYVFPLVGAAYLLVIGVLPGGPLPAAVGWLGLAVALALMLCTVAIAAEAVFAYMTFSSWALAYHARRSRARQRRIEAPYEIATLVGAGLMAYVCDVGAVTYCDLRFGGFSRAAADPGRGLAASLGDGAYAAFTAFIGVGDANPGTPEARLVSTLIQVQYLGFMVLAFAVLAGIALVASEDHRRRVDRSGDPRRGVIRRGRRPPGTPHRPAALRRAGTGRGRNR